MNLKENNFVVQGFLRFYNTLNILTNTLTFSVFHSSTTGHPGPDQHQHII